MEMARERNRLTVSLSSRSRSGSANRLITDGVPAGAERSPRKLLLGRFLLVVRAGCLAEDERRRRQPGRPDRHRGDHVGPDIGQGVLAAGLAEASPGSGSRSVSPQPGLRTNTCRCIGT